MNAIIESEAKVSKQEKTPHTEETIEADDFPEIHGSDKENVSSFSLFQIGDWYTTNIIRLNFATNYA